MIIHWGEGLDKIEHERENLSHLREYLNHLKKTGCKSSKGNEKKKVTGNWREVDPFYIVSQNLVELHCKDM